MKDIQVKLTEQEIKRILAALADKPYKQVVELINKLEKLLKETK
jgi:hypothetical protein